MGGSFLAQLTRIHIHANFSINLSVEGVPVSFQHEQVQDLLALCLACTGQLQAAFQSNAQAVCRRLRPLEYATDSSTGSRECPECSRYAVCCMLLLPLTKCHKFDFLTLFCLKPYLQVGSRFRRDSLACSCSGEGVRAPRAP